MGMAQKRKGLTLDLNAAAGVGPSGHGIFSKKSKLAASHILTSPDVQKLKLSSPELAEFLTRNPTLATPTPSGGNYIFPKTVTEEQESYVKGFEVALKNLQQHQIPEQTITGSHVGLPSVIKNLLKHRHLKAGEGVVLRKSLQSIWNPKKKL